MNEILFISQASLVSFAVLVFARLGKESLTAYISLLFVITNIFVIKQINVWGWYATSADAFIIGVSFGINLLQEIWGKEIARKTIWISFACSVFYMIMTQFLVAYQASNNDTTHIHFAQLMSHTLRITFASFTSYIITQIADTYLYAYVRKRTNDNYFVARNYLSMCSSQLFDTILFTFLGLYGVMTNLLDLIIISYILKLLAIGLTTPFLVIAKKTIEQ